MPDDERKKLKFQDAFEKVVNGRLPGMLRLSMPQNQSSEMASWGHRMRGFPLPAITIAHVSESCLAQACGADPPTDATIDLTLGKKTIEDKTDWFVSGLSLDEAHKAVSSRRALRAKAGSTFARWLAGPPPVAALQSAMRSHCKQAGPDNSGAGGDDEHGDSEVGRNAGSMTPHQPTGSTTAAPPPPTKAPHQATGITTPSPPRPTPAASQQPPTRGGNRGGNRGGGVTEAEIEEAVSHLCPLLVVYGVESTLAQLELACHGGVTPLVQAFEVSIGAKRCPPHFMCFDDSCQALQSLWPSACSVVRTLTSCPAGLKDTDTDTLVRSARFALTAAMIAQFADATFVTRVMLRPDRAETLLNAEACCKALSELHSMSQDPANKAPQNVTAFLEALELAGQETALKMALARCPKERTKPLQLKQWESTLKSVADSLAKSSNNTAEFELDRLRIKLSRQYPRRYFRVRFDVRPQQYLFKQTPKRDKFGREELMPKRGPLLTQIAALPDDMVVKALTGTNKDAMVLLQGLDGMEFFTALKVVDQLQHIGWVPQEVSLVGSLIRPRADLPACTLFKSALQYVREPSLREYHTFRKQLLRKKDSLKEALYDLSQKGPKGNVLICGPATSPSGDDTLRFMEALRERWPGVARSHIELRCAANPESSLRYTTPCTQHKEALINLECSRMTLAGSDAMLCEVHKQHTTHTSGSNRQA